MSTTSCEPLPRLAVRLPQQRRPVDQPLPVPTPRRRLADRARLLVAALVLAALGGDAGPSPAADTTVRAYFFGDSLMAGTGTSPRRPLMAHVAADRLGWAVDVDGWGGTGWTTTGRSPGYLDRLRRPGALPGRYDVVLLEGGTNDARVGSSPVQVRAAVREVVAEVRRRQPSAAVVLMGAYDPPGVLDLRRGVADAAVAQAAAELGLPFFSPLSGGWHDGQPAERFLDDDGLHPDEWGYGVLGERLAAALSSLPLGRSSHSPQTASSAP